MLSTLQNIPPFLGNLLGATIGVLGAVYAIQHGHKLKEKTDKKKVAKLIILELEAAKGLLATAINLDGVNEEIIKKMS